MVPKTNTNLYTALWISELITFVSLDGSLLTSDQRRDRHWSHSARFARERPVDDERSLGGSQGNKAL